MPTGEPVPRPIPAIAPAHGTTPPPSPAEMRGAIHAMLEVVSDETVLVVWQLLHLLLSDTPQPLRRFPEKLLLC